jgi:hypothetical protein
MIRSRLVHSSIGHSARFCLPLAAVALLATPARGQSDAGPAPPAHLPRVIWECEAAVGATSNTCSAWIWHGTSYSATWSIGAIGQLTVASGAAAELSVRRLDTTGSLAGLTATYTGKWDGARFSDGKMTFTFKGASNTGVWTARPAVTPVIHTLLGTVQTVTQDEIYGVGRRPAPYYNWYAADLTGFAVHTKGLAGSGVSTALDDFRVRGEQPMKAGERRELNLRSVLLRPNYDNGAAYHPGAAVAAIYSDGTTFGDRKVLAAMIDYRRSMLASLTNIGATLCTLGTRNSSIADAEAALNKQHAADDARSPADKDARGAAYTTIGKSLGARGTGRLPPSQIIKQTLDRLNQLRSGLADPVKNSSGQPAMAPATALACSLH